MDFGAEREKPWKAPKLRKRVRTLQLCRILKPNIIFRMCKRLFSGLCCPTPQPLGHHHDPAFMACVIKVDPSKRGWHKAVSKVAANCEDTRFKMDETGVVEVCGIGDPNQVLKKLGKSRHAKIRHLQYGQCSKKLFIPEAKTKSSSQPQPPNYHNPPTVPPYNRPFLPSQGGYNGYPYYQQQQQQPPPYLEHRYNHPSHQGYGYPHYQPHLEYGMLPPYGY